jgi:hypothetical protein
MLAANADANLKFLFNKQLEEADVVCFTKSDVTSTYPSMPKLDSFDLRRISARSGNGVAAWLDEMLSGTLSAGSRILDIDYEQYARAEAALSWLNFQVDIRSNSPVSPAALLGPFFDDLDASLTAGYISIVHMKAIVHSPTGFVKSAICANGQEPVVEGNLDASPATNHSLLLNLRALGAASEVQAIVEENLRRIDGPLDNLTLSCFHPAAPNPERRVAEIRSVAP